MRKSTAILFTMLSITGIALLSSCDLFKQDYETRIFGDFMYKYIKSSSAKITYEDGDYVAIYELTEEGKTKETLIIPNEIDDKPVIKIGMPGSANTRNIFSCGGTFTSIYLPKSLETMGCHWLCDSKKIYMINSDNYYIHGYKGHNSDLYLSESLYNEYINYYEEDDLEYTSLHIANLEFVSDGETYFIADYEEGDLITYVPEEPTKDGYKFAGWFKESECINEWDFEVDTFTLEENETIMKLYAGWTKR